MESIETEESSYEASNNQLIMKTKKSMQNEDSSIFPKEFITLEKIFSLKDQLNNISFEREGKYLLKKLYFSEDDKKLYKLLLIKGVIPVEYRPDFWFISSGARRECIRHPNYYKFICENYPNNKNSIREEREIEKDIKRSFPEENFFRDDKNLARFRRILNSYYKRNLSGYTQGCNQIVGRLFETVDDEEKTFWIFSQLMEDILTVDYYSRMLGIFTDIDIVICLLRDLYLPDIVQKLEKTSGFQILFDTLVKWFVTLFIEHFPKKFQLLVWDLLFLDKKIVLYKVSIALWQKYKYQISQLSGIESFVEFTKNFSLDFNDETFLKYILFIKNYEFDDNFLNLERRFIIEKKKKWEKEFMNKIKTKKIENDLCNTNWPSCIYDENFRQDYNDTVVYSQLEQCEIIEDYFKYENRKKYLKNRNYLDLTKGNLTYKKLNYKNILIQRRKHFCYKFNKNVKYDIVKDVQKKEEIKNKINLENNAQNEEDDYLEKKKKYKQIRTRQYVSNYNNSVYPKINLNNKIENYNDIREEEDIAKYLSKEFINYSRYRIDNLRLSRLPTKIEND